MTKHFLHTDSSEHLHLYHTHKLCAASEHGGVFFDDSEIQLERELAIIIDDLLIIVHWYPGLEPHQFDQHTLPVIYAYAGIVVLYLCDTGIKYFLLQEGLYDAGILYPCICSPDYFYNNNFRTGKSKLK